MTTMRLIWIGAAGLAILLSASMSAAAPAIGTPPVVNSYAVQQAALCRNGPDGTTIPAAADRADLNSDGLLDWIFDASRQPCVAGNPMAKEYGALVTVFLATPEGDARPGLQMATHGARLERVAGKTRLILTLAGAECGEAQASTRCDRPVVWSAQEKRLNLLPLAPAAKLAGT